MSTHDLVFHCLLWASDAAEVLERMRSGDEDADGFDGPEDEIVRAGRALTWDQLVDDVLRVTLEGGAPHS